MLADWVGAHRGGGRLAAVQAMAGLMERGDEWWEEESDNDAPPLPPA